MVTKINQRTKLANRYRMERRVDHLVKQDTFMLHLEENLKGAQNALQNSFY